MVMSDGEQQPGLPTMTVVRRHSSGASSNRLYPSAPHCITSGDYTRTCCGRQPHTMLISRASTVRPRQIWPGIGLWRAWREMMLTFPFFLLTPLACDEWLSLMAATLRLIFAGQATPYSTATYRKFNSAWDPLTLLSISDSP